MANAEAAPVHPADTRPADTHAALIVSLSSTPVEQLSITLEHLQQAFAGQSVIVVSPDLPAPDTTSFPGLTLLPHAEGVPVRGSWTLTASEFTSAYQQAVAHGASACLLLGPDSNALSPEAIRGLASAVLTGGADLCTPEYVLAANEGLVNSALLYPLSRALYNAPTRFPLAVDMGLSLRLAERLASAAASPRPNLTTEGEPLLWPVSEAAVAGLGITQIPVQNRPLPVPNVSDLNTLLAQVMGSLFSDIEARATFWQRSRPSSIAPPVASTPVTPVNTEQTDIEPLVEGFRVAYSNLAEIWSIVLPPQSLLGLKRLSAVDAASFRMPPSLWARIVYDFVLAFRLRTINRGHLLGALTPLYLAWVASHLLLTRSGVPNAEHISETAAAFTAEKPYFVSRWRWPDRFNP